MSTIIESAKKIKCLICDVDGVLTDGLIHLDDTGHETKTFHVLDGMGLKFLMFAGIEVAIITTSTTAVIDHRMAQLGIRHYYKQQRDKREPYAHLKQTLQLSDEECAYIGDDLPDLPIIKQVGLGVAVANAVQQVKEFARYETQLRGGNGAVREVCDLILLAQNKFDDAIERYLRS